MKSRIQVGLHRTIHKKLNLALTELVTDWTEQTGCCPTQNTVSELIEWSAGQVKKPTEKPLIEEPILLGRRPMMADGSMLD